MGIYCRPAGIYIYLHPVAVHAQSFAAESTYTTLTVKARAGLRSAAWGKLIHVGPASQPSYQYVLCTGLLGPVLKILAVGMCLTLLIRLECFSMHLFSIKI